MEPTLREELDKYLNSYNFGDTPGGYEDRYFKFYIFRSFGIKLPNIIARREAARIHDINHILTRYKPIEWEGEVQIAFFEYGAGFGKYWFARLIDAGALPLGIFWPRKSWQAFFRGRKALSLYRNSELISLYLDKPVGDFRKKVNLA